MKIILDKAKYEDKVKACWIGKNIGGTIGTPYEGTHDVLDVKGFVTKPGEPLPNDDLDLQLVWLHALETVGVHNISARLLGELWVSLIPPHWNEYGICKANMIRGLVPPLAADHNSTWTDSNGAWIRTEVWACSAPALPALAAKLAVEDAKVDHGAGEGTYAAAFVAAMQSAAFALDNLYDCIEIGLNAIPEDCRVGKTVKFAIDSYKSGKSWVDTRNEIQKMNADIGNGWFEAPSNVGYTIIGLLYGEGDFKKSMITAVNCGDDTDCTAATVGATLGILYGSEKIPADWSEYIGDKIITMSINQSSVGRTLPATCSELSRRVCDIAPAVVTAHRCYEAWDTWLYRVDFGAENDIDAPEAKKQMLDAVKNGVKRPLASLKPYTLNFKEAYLEAEMVLSAVDVKPGATIEANLKLFTNKLCDNLPFAADFRWMLPEGFVVDGPKSLFIPHRSRHTESVANASFSITAPEKVEAKNRLVLEVTIEGRPTAIYIPVLLIG